jgi:hypothetical protein
MDRLRYTGSHRHKSARNSGRVVELNQNKKRTPSRVWKKAQKRPRFALEIFQLLSENFSNVLSGSLTNQTAPSTLHGARLGCPRLPDFVIIDRR